MSHIWIGVEDPEVAQVRTHLPLDSTKVAAMDVRRSSWRWVPLPMCWLIVAVAIHADDNFTDHPLEPAVTTSPRATLSSFLESFRVGFRLVQQRGMQRGLLTAREQELFRMRVMGCLDVSEVPPSLLESQSTAAAVYLKEVIDRLELPPESEWPDENDEEDLPLDKWTIPHSEITIARVREGRDEGKFLFSPETVERAEEFYDRIKHLPYQDRDTVTPNVISFFNAEPGSLLPRSWIVSLPAWAHHRSGGQATWQWFGLVIALIFALVALLTLYFVGMRFSRKGGEKDLSRYLISLAFPAMAMFVPMITYWFVEDQLRVTGDVLTGINYILNVTFLFTLIMVVMGTLSRLAALIISTRWIKPKGMDAQIIRLATRVLGIVAAIVILLEGGQRIGIPLTTLVAGAGVSGLALALAAQDTLKNVFGSLMISLDKPYRVGERIVVKGYDGVVEEVGLRSTKIRTLTGHQTSIPNEEMARSDIENVGRRPYIRRVSDIPIPLDTLPDKIERAVDIVREIVDEHEGMKPEYPPRVFFNDFNRDSFNIRMILWYHPPNYWEYLAFCQNINSRIVAAFEAEGIQFALPANMTYLAQNEDQSVHIEIPPKSEPLDRSQVSQKQ